MAPKKAAARKKIAPEPPHVTPQRAYTAIAVAGLPQVEPSSSTLTPLPTPNPKQPPAHGPQPRPAPPTSNASKKRRRAPEPAAAAACQGVAEKLGAGPPLRLIIIGHNPSEASWRAGHVYAHPANWMWRILIKTGLAPPGTRGAEDDDRLPGDWGVGFTDLGTGHPGTLSSSFSSEVLQGRWREDFYSRLRAHLGLTARWLRCTCGCCGAPSIVAFSGKRMYIELLNAGLKGKQRVKTVEYGPQQLLPSGWPLPPSTAVWVCPSTSGAAAMRSEEREAPYADLAQSLQLVPWPRPPLLACRGDSGTGSPEGEGNGNG